MPKFFFAFLGFMRSKFYPWKIRVQEMARSNDSHQIAWVERLQCVCFAYVAVCDHVICYTQGGWGTTSFLVEWPS